MPNHAFKDVRDIVVSESIWIHIVGSIAKNDALQLAFQRCAAHF